MPPSTRGKGKGKGKKRAAIELDAADADGGGKMPHRVLIPGLPQALTQDLIRYLDPEALHHGAKLSTAWRDEAHKEEHWKRLFDDVICPRVPGIGKPEPKNAGGGSASAAGASSAAASEDGAGGSSSGSSAGAAGGSNGASAGEGATAAAASAAKGDDDGLYSKLCASAKAFNYRRLCLALSSKNCMACGDRTFGFFELSCSRVCWHCFSGDHQYRMCSLGHAKALYLLSDAQSSTLPVIRVNNAVETGLPAKEGQFMNITTCHAAKQCAYSKWGGEEGFLLEKQKRKDKATARYQAKVEEYEAAVAEAREQGKSRYDIGMKHPEQGRVLRIDGEMNFVGENQQRAHTVGGKKYGYHGHVRVLDKPVQSGASAGAGAGAGGGAGVAGLFLFADPFMRLILGDSDVMIM